MVYLKTYFYVEHEIKFLILNLLEAYDHIDKFIICEYNRTHTGMPRDFIFEKYIDRFPKDKFDKVMYLKCDIGDMTVEAYDNEDAIHAVNEPVMRGFFTKAVDLQDEDIVFSVDADEIIYSQMYPELIEYVSKNNIVQLNLNQFFYKVNYFWKNKDFLAPTVAKYKVFKNHFPSQWRYQGPIYPKKAGCHFSWCMSPKEMVYKLHTYSHPRYRHLADEDVLQQVIENKEYPFDKNVSFNIEELSLDHPILPKQLENIDLNPIEVFDET